MTPLYTSKSMIDNEDNKKSLSQSNTFNFMFLKKKLEMISLFFIVIGALNWGLVGLLGFNLVTIISKYTFTWIENIVYIVVGVSALVHIASRNYYLPFLGDAVFPCNSMLPKTPENADTKVMIETIPNSNVIYWASETNQEILDNPWVAYAEYSNAGVTKADVNGVAVLRFRTPSSYKIPNGLRTLSPHVHYRVCQYPGMMSEVKTVMISK
jgi:uncharacterized membrane protein YuzA (DUF378 family)